MLFCAISVPHVLLVNQLFGILNGWTSFRIPLQFMSVVSSVRQTETTDWDKQCFKRKYYYFSMAYN